MNLKKTKLMFCALVLVLAFCSIQAYGDFSVPARMNWWYEARFGMFIHFGSYSYLAHGEWAYALEGWTKANYQTQVSAPFNPTSFDATVIANCAKNAGMKYLVITAKHHEGFAMWNSSVASFRDYTGTTLYNLNNYAAFKSTGRDILLELKNACDAVGVKFCLYYSILDWNHPSQTGTNFTTMASMEARAAYITDMKAQLSELISRYNPAVLWFDGDWTGNTGEPTLSSWWTLTDGIDLYNYLLGLKTDIVINERVFRGAGIGDFDCPEQTVPSVPKTRQWETCQTMNGVWGYTDWAESNYRTAQSLLQELVTVVSREGNYLLNIGPKGDGSVSTIAQSILGSMGTWMTTYGDALYGTTGTPFMSDTSFNEPSWGRYTKKDGKLFACVFTWPTTGTLTISGISNTISRIYLMNNPSTSLGYSWSGDNINISVPVSAPDANVSVVVVECSGVPSSGTSTTTQAPTSEPTAAPTADPTTPPADTPAPTDIAAPTDAVTTPAPTDAPTDTPAPTVTPGPTTIPTATPVGVTADPTSPPVDTTAPTPDPTADPTTPPVDTAVPTTPPSETPAPGGCTCMNLCSSSTVITVPFTYDGVGEYCRTSSSLGTYVNSWNTDAVNINGTNCTNTYISSSSISAISGVYYIYYKGSYAWSHIEIK